MRDSSDIEQTMNTFADAVWRACLVYLSAVDAEDVFQDTFMKYALYDQTFRSEEHKKAWLLRVAINACKDFLKAKRTKNASLDDRLDPDGELADSQALQTQSSNEGLREILDAMDSLGDPPKTELYLSLYEGYSAREISQITGEPEGTVYSWISRGKKKLREVLQ